MTVEHWLLDHPNRGKLEVLVGPAEVLREYDPDFPKSDKEKENKNVESESAEDQDVEGKSLEEGSSEKYSSGDVRSGSPGKSKKTREWAGKPGIRGHAAKIVAELMEDYPVLVRQDDRIIARMRNLQNVRISLDKVSKSVGAGKYGYEMAGSEPFLKLQKNFTGAHLNEVIVRTRGETVKFDPPAGSPAEKRERAMEESPTKRWLYPLASGLGKGGWALVVLVIGPMVSRLIDAIWGLIEPHLPDWELPSIPWPHIDFPEIYLPSIPWPHINWPHIDLPDWHMPGWLEPIFHLIGIAMEYSKIWVPVLIGIFIGISSVRRNKKSHQAKKKWENGHTEKAATGTELAKNIGSAHALGASGQTDEANEVADGGADSDSAIIDRGTIGKISEPGEGYETEEDPRG